MKRRSRLSFLARASLVALLASQPALAAEPDSKKAEAAQRFDRGLALFDDGDNSGALAEFRRTYELFPNPVVLYNIGLVYAAMRRPVDAVDALEKVVDAESLSAEQRDRAKLTLADQKARIGRVMVTTVPDGARIEVDNVEVAKTPLTAPIRVAEGSHIIGAVAEGYTPARKEIVVAGNADSSLKLELVSSEGKQLGNLTLKSKTAGADVHVDGEVVGKTPLTTSITLVTGHHAVELRRPGYTSQKRELDIGAGATGELTIDLSVDAAALPTDGATLALDVSESEPVLFVDGEHKGPYTGPVRLPKGPHRIRVERGGFLPFEREVNLDPSASSVVEVNLDPTPETRTSYEKSAHAHRLWGWIGILGGAAVAGGGGAYLAINAGPKKDASDAWDDYISRRENEEPPCNVRSEGVNPEDCNNAVTQKEERYNDIKKRDLFGYVGIGVGGAMMVTGVILLLTGDDPDRYDTPPAQKLGRARLGPSFALTGGPGEVGTGFRMVF